MKRTVNYWLMFSILAIAQIAFSAIVSIPDVLILSILPALMAIVPIRYNTNMCLVVAFVTGFLVDFFTDGLLGLTSLALVPAALLRIPVLTLVSGREILANKTDSPASYMDGGRLFLVLFIANLIYFFIYIMADAAGLFPFRHNLGGIFVSSMASTVLGYLAAKLLISNKA